MFRAASTLFALFALCLSPVGSAMASEPTAGVEAEDPVAPGEIVDRSFTNSAGIRPYQVYVPTSGGASKPLMIWLHGCGGPDPLEKGHALVKVAEEMGFSIAFPIEPASANPLECWNWFLGVNQRRGSGEASIIAGITTSLRDELGSDPSRIYVGGYSAGGAMTTILGAAYPDLYAAIAPSAGAPYKIFDVDGSMAYAEMGARARPMPVFMLQGLTDGVSNYLVGRANLRQWLGTNDYADDGRRNYSVSRLPSSVEPRVINTDVPLPVSIEHYRSDGCAITDFVTSPYEHLLNGALFYYDSGLELQRTMMGFLLDHRLGGACG